ncbi:putative endonuclease lcl3 [Recurvomyces mirabilis]|uniref:Probable endonuclease LCL3 n=1 Tax=Recurvomyces mirabilis TaxID=574656 RepID=A0AAE1C2L3_9PEZI|nr:putative endonuclease lcl3 [Recurvomyces mirabilis]KAK5155947.1 putative endonuclease lcl3 [Recurvomyces mirabilis]
MPLSDWLWNRNTHQKDDGERILPALPVQHATKDEAEHKQASRSQFLEPRIITACVITAGATFAALRFYRMYLKRVPTAGHIKPTDFHKRSLYGYVTSVGDGDGFHLFHTPGGPLAGWGWYRGRRPQESDRKKLKDQTISPYGPEALAWLRSAIQGTYVRTQVHRVDQYQRVVGTAYRRKWLFFRSDIGLEMLKLGLATVYEAKSGAEFGGKEEVYRAAEKKAKSRGVGMWQNPGLVGRLLGRKATAVETPREYKTKVAAKEREVQVGDKKV